MKQKTLTNWLCLSGIVAFVLYVTATLVAPLYYPSYNWVIQPISDLGALSSPSRLTWLMIWTLGSACAVLSVTVVSIAFQLKVNRTFRTGIHLFATMTWLSLGYTMFPLSEGGNAGTVVDTLHLYVVTPLVMVTTITSLILIVVGAYTEPLHHSLASIAGIVLLLVCIGGAGIGLAGETHFGLFERVTIYAIMAFTAVLGVFGFRETQASIIHTKRLND